MGRQANSRGGIGSILERASAASGRIALPDHLEDILHSRLSIVTAVGLRQEQGADLLQSTVIDAHH